MDGTVRPHRKAVAANHSRELLSAFDVAVNRHSPNFGNDSLCQLLDGRLICGKRVRRLLAGRLIAGFQLDHRQFVGGDDVCRLFPSLRKLTGGRLFRHDNGAGAGQSCDGA